VDNPVNELVKLPTPVPSAVLLSAIVGVPVVFQHTPRAVTALPPSPVTLPPLEAVVPVIANTAPCVVTPSAFAKKFAVIDWSAFIVTVNGFVVPVAPPVQPVKRPVPFGVAVKVTTVPALKLNVLKPAAVLIPAGLLITLPDTPAASMLTTNRAKVVKLTWFP